MTIEVIAVENRIMTRVKTGLFSFDLASASQGNIGHPIFTIIEVYGYWGVGKSSFCYFLAGKFAQALDESGNIQLLDLEGFDKSYILSSLTQAKYSGKLRIVPHISDKGKLKTHSEMATDFLNFLEENENYHVGIFDSVGSFVSNMEQVGDIGDANWGKRAIAINQIMRKSSSIIQSRKTPLTLLVTNHVNAVMGGKGHDTPGGNAVKFMSASRIYLQNIRAIENKDTKVAYEVGGRFEKMRFGGKGKRFQFALIPNIGVSPELTAIFDCINLGLAKEDRIIRIKDEKFGYMTKLVEYAAEKRTEKFEPFFAELESYYEQTSLGINTMEEDESNSKSSPEILDE